jgi:hypothetical protein
MPIVAAILAVLGPLLLNALERWLKRQLEVKAAGYAPMGDPRADAEALLRAVRDDLWAWQWRKKNFLAQAIRDVPPVVAGRALLTDAQKAYLSKLGQDAA